jgi:lipopolysaccharide export system protein LptA
MIKAFVISFLFLVIFSSTTFTQESNEKITVIGDSLIGKMIEGESIREVIGNVTLTQGKVVVTCNRAIQYLSRNEAELIGNVVLKQDSLTIKTKQGFYFGNSKTTKSVSGIVLDDQKVILSADSGEYFFNEDRAFFETNVILRDSAMTLTADELTYFQKDDRAISVGNVTITDENNVITADSLDHFRNTKQSIADGHVKIVSYDNNTIIFGDHLEDYAEKKYTLINENPVLLQIDTIYTAEKDSVESFRIDSLIIKCEVMEGMRDTANIFKAKDSVKIIRGAFASVNDFTLYLRTDKKIITEKMGDKGERPILWYENSQLTGDSITIYLEENEIKSLDVNSNAFMLSQSKTHPERFDQTSSNNLQMYFEESNIKSTKFEGSVYSIYYMFEDEEPTGLTKSSAKAATIIFFDNEVSEVRLYGSPTSEYHPENKVIGIERTFTLPKFIFYKNRPVKENLLSGLEN